MFREATAAQSLMWIASTESWAVSQVTALKLIVGARDKKDVSTIDGLLTTLGVMPLSERIAFRAYQLLKTYAKAHGLHVFDALVAATAIEKGRILVSRNQRHYRIIRGLQLEVPDY